MKKKDIKAYEITFGRLTSLYAEIEKLSAKKPNDTINKFKLDVINQTLLECKMIFGEELLPIKDFEKFDESSMPFNSDVVMVLALYEDSMRRFKKENSHKVGHNFEWDTAGTEEWNED